MILPSLLLSFLFSGEKIVINEFAYDDTGTDTIEFVEIYNSSGAPVDISGWKLESNDQVGPNTSYVVPANTTLAAGDFYVFGSALVPNVDQIVGVSNIWENSQESLILKDTEDNIIDSVSYEGNKGTWPGRKSEGEGIWGNHFCREGHETSWSRLRDGFDTNNNHDFRNMPWSPGQTNNVPPGFVIDNFDALPTLTAHPAFGSSFVDAFIIDPTIIDINGHNPSSIPVSPQGGNAMICWDQSGGGNMNMLLRDPTCDVIIEAYVYFDSSLRTSGEFDTWTIGHGTTASFYNSPDPSGVFGFTANGNTGVGWTYQVTDSGATLYLIDHNDGGRGTLANTNRTILGTIVVDSTNDGWQRLRLELSGDDVTGYFGGTLGGTNGTKITGKREMPALGSVYIAYREAFMNNAAGRPPTLDALTILPAADSSVVDTSFGKSKATTVGTPRVGTNGCPIVGNGAFQLAGVDFTPSSSAIWALGLVAGNPIDMTLIGGQPGSLLYVTPVLIITVPTPASGQVLIPAAIPNTPALMGSSVDVQAFDNDPAISTPVKLGNSRVTTLKIG